MTNNNFELARTLFLGLTTILLISCSNSKSIRNEAKDTTIVNTNVTEAIPDIPTDYSEFPYTLPQSGYTYNIKITDIKTKISKDAFTTKEDQYSTPKKVDGYFLTIKFAIKNPYDKEMMAPVPNYYFIASANGEWFSSSTTNDRTCHCQIDNSTKVTNLKGKELWQISKERCGYNDYCLHFSPNETKEFKIAFTDPIFGKVKKIFFNGFGHRGLLIDIDSKKIVGHQDF